MNVENQVKALAGVQCGACKAGNLSDAKFCAGCGQSLFEKCGSCAKPILLTQNYCGECGTDLDRVLADRRQRHESWMADAVAAAREHDYARAKELLDRVAEVKDYRFKDQASDAMKAIEKVRQLEQQTVSAVERATALAIEANRAGRNHEVARHLASVPSRLLGDEAKELLARAQAFTRQWTLLESDVKTAIGEKDWILVGRSVQQLIELDAGHEPYRKLASQVTEKLQSDAERSLDDGNYELAVAQLDAIPTATMTEAISRFRERVDDIYWMSEQFDREPYASPALGRLAVRLAKEVPKDLRMQKLVKQLAEKLKQAPRPPRMPLPAWKGHSTSWLGGEAGILGFPTCVDCGENAEFRLNAGRWNIALGLALQGLGQGRFQEDLLIKKKGLLSFGKRKSKACWGIDVGAGSFKAVCLELGDAIPRVIDSFFVEYEEPLCRKGKNVNELKTLKPIVDRFLVSKEPGGIPIWANLTSSQTVNRFVRLPPVKDKEAKNLLAQEVEQKVPIPLDELCIATWIHELGEDVTVGRPAVATCARKSVVSARMDLLEASGLTLAGLQSDAFALANFASLEFRSLWPQDSKGGQVLCGERQDNKSIVLLDCGASVTNIVMVSGESHWSWTLEFGGEDLTALVAKSTKITHDEAEKLKRNPAAIPSPSKAFQPVERRLDEVKARLEMISADARKQNSDWKVIQSWCMGGGAQMHQWVRRIMVSAVK